MISVKKIGVSLAIFSVFGFTNALAQAPGSERLTWNPESDPAPEAVGEVLNSAPHIGEDPMAIACDSVNGDVYIVDLFTGNYYVYGDDLTPIGSFTHPFGTATTTGITFNDNSGNTLFICTAVGDTCIETTLTGVPVAGAFVLANPAAGLLVGMAYDSFGTDGNPSIWYMDIVSDLVIEASTSGAFKSSWGPPCGDPGGCFGTGIDATNCCPYPSPDEILDVSSGDLGAGQTTGILMTTEVGNVLGVTSILPTGDTFINDVCRDMSYLGGTQALILVGNASNTIYVVEAYPLTCPPPCGPDPAGCTATVSTSTPDPATTSQIAACVHIDMGSNPDPLGSYGAELSWDPTVLDYVNWSGGDVPFEEPLVNTDDVGLGTLTFADADASGAEGKVYVSCGQFDVIGAANSSSTLDLELTSVFTAETFIDLTPVSAAVDDSVSVILECTIGDVNGDGSINSGDALIILSYGIGLPIPSGSEERLATGCGNADGQDAAGGGPCNCCDKADDTTPGCDCQACEDAVCAQNNFCCAVVWDFICDGDAQNICTCCSGQNPGTCDGGGYADAADANVILSFEIGLDVSGNPIDSSNATTDDCADCSGDRGESCGSGGNLMPPGETVHVEVLTDAASQLDPRQPFEAWIVVDTRSAGLPLGSYTARLEWDPGLLEFLGTTGGSRPGFQSPMMNLAQVSTGLLRFTDANPYGASGRVELLRAHFRPRWAVRDPERQLQLSFSSMATTGPGFERLNPVIEGRAFEQPALRH